ncbi:MAG: hypothetical protein LBQ14_00470 [Treponema sp.]|jgi:hypothetical protein|nr:hypothetical protein [Treponema sp.]
MLTGQGRPAAGSRLDRCFWGACVELRDFLYQYTTIFFSEAVKETILIENWEETGFDRRYVEYAGVFLEIKKECSVKGLSGEAVLGILMRHKKRIVNLFNKKMGKHFIEEFQKHRFNKQEIKTLFPKHLFFNRVVQKLQFLNNNRLKQQKTWISLRNPRFLGDL